MSGRVNEEYTTLDDVMYLLDDCSAYLRNLSYQQRLFNQRTVFRWSERLMKASKILEKKYKRIRAEIIRVK